MCDEWGEPTMVLGGDFLGGKVTGHSVCVQRFLVVVVVGKDVLVNLFVFNNCFYP